MRTDTVYTPSDCCDTLGKPTVIERLERAGDDLDIFRRGVMERREIGLTSLYNLIHNPVIQEEDILRLRAIHVEIDQAVQEAYALDEGREGSAGVRVGDTEATGLAMRCSR